MDAEELALWKRCRQGDLAARGQLVLLHEPLAQILGRQAVRIFSWVDPQDLGQCARLGLIDAVDRFDPGRGVPFGAYARYWIKARLYGSPEVRRGITPRLLRNQRRIQAGEEAWVQAHGSAPTLIELAEATGLSVLEIDQALEIRAFCFTISIDALQELDEDPDAWEAHLRSEVSLGWPGGDEEDSQDVLVRQVESWLDRLKPFEREVLILTYWEGLKDEAIRRQLFECVCAEEEDLILRQRQLNRIKQARKRAIMHMRQFCE